MVLRKAVTVSCTVDDAFRVFTEGIATWWPLRTHSVSKDRAVTCALEGKVGGRLFERDSEGAEHAWGVILVWEPPHRFVFTWYPGRNEDTAQQVEVWFSAAADGTRVDLEHRGWEKYGEGVDEAFKGYDTGWDLVFGDRYSQAANAASPATR
jgi:uncharacterized protein YndB with AHSA1/START domain